MVKLQGAKALTHAREVEVHVNIAKAELDETRAKLKGIRLRTDELKDLLAELQERAVSALDLLESETFDVHAHADRFQRAITLVMAVRDVAATPVVSAMGELNEHSENLTIKYRPMVEENERG